MSFCLSCGKSLSEGSNNCGFCGAPIPPAIAIAATAQPAGMSVNAAGALAYLAGFITGILFLVIDPYKKDPFVRFHAFQSIFFNVAWIGFWFVWMIVGMVLSAITKGLFFLIQMPVDVVLMLGGFCLWAYLMYAAYQGKKFRLPVIGALAEKQAGL
ncbi:MAG: hypothetical protein ABSF17_03485 [Terracidiphilus sp.]